MIYLFFSLTTLKIVKHTEYLTQEYLPIRMDSILDAEIILNVATFKLILHVIHESIKEDSEKQEMKDNIQFMIFKTGEYIKNNGILNENMMKLRDVILPLMKSIDWEGVRKIKNISDVLQDKELYTGELQANEIELCVNYLGDLGDLLKAFNVNKIKQLHDYYPLLSHAIRITTHVYNRLTQVLIYNIYDEIYRGININSFQKMACCIFKKFNSCSKTKRESFSKNINSGEKYLYNSYLNKNHNIFEVIMRALLERIMINQPKNTILCSIMTKLNSLFITIVYILKEPIIQLREKQIDLCMVRALELIKLRTEKYEFIYNELSFDASLAGASGSEYNNSNVNVGKKLNTEILKIFSHKCVNCVNKTFNNCIKTSLYTLLESISRDFVNISKYDLEEGLNMKEYMKKKINVFISNQNFRNNNPNESVEYFKIYIDELKDVLYKEMTICMLDGDSELNKQVSIVEAMIKEVLATKVKYEFFMHELDKKITLRSSIDIHTFNLLFNALNCEDKAEEFLKLDNDLLNQILLINWNILEYDYELLMSLSFQEYFTDISSENSNKDEIELIPSQDMEDFDIISKIGSSI